MKKLLIIIALAMLGTLCIAVNAAEEHYVYDAPYLLEFASTGGGLAFDTNFVIEDEKVYASAKVTGSTATGQDNTQINLNLEEDFKLKDYPILKVSYRSNAASNAKVDFNLGMIHNGNANARAWGYFADYKKTGENAEMIVDLSKVFTGGENLGGSYSWDSVDADSPVRYIRLKPYYSMQAMKEGEYFDIEYIGFFKTEKAAKEYKHDSSVSFDLKEIDLTIKAVRKLVGESFDIEAVPVPHYANMVGVTYSSENTEIATVDANGKVTAVSAGDTYIVATTASGLTAKCHIYVLEDNLPAVTFVPRGIQAQPVRINCLGDSITTYAPNPDGGMNYYDWFGKWYTVSGKDYGISGASLTANGQNPFVHRYDDMIDNAEMVFVKGGTNDFGITALGSMTDRSLTTYRGSLRFLMEGLIEKYPNSQIVFLSPIKRCEGGQTPATKNSAGNTLNDFADAVVEMAEIYGIHAIDLYKPEELDFTSPIISRAYTDANGKWHDSVCEDDRMPDGLHPSGKGHEIMAKYILNELVEMGVVEIYEGTAPFIKGSGFKDTLKHWACDNIDVVVRKSLFNGVTKTEFAPNNTMTRGMLVTVLSRLAKDTENTTEYPFKDVAADAWFAPGVSFAYANGIVDAGEAFRPDDNITREELADMLYRYAKKTGKNTELAEISFADTDKITASMVDAIAYCVKAGILKGYDNNTVNPTGSATRAEVATMIVRFIKAK